MIIALLALAMSPPPASAALDPSGKWSVEYEDSSCVLSRSFGAGEEAITLALRPTPLGTRVDMFLLTARKPDGRGRAEFKLLPDGTTTIGRYERVRTADGARSGARLIFEDDPLTTLPSAQAMTMSVGPDTYRLTLPAVASAMKALTACQTDLLRSWNVDPEELTDGGKRPMPISSLGRWFNLGAYPSDALAKKAGGRVVALIAVSSAGKPTACTVVRKAEPSLDKQTCDIAMLRFQFKPGLDPAGKPRHAHYVLPVNWIYEY